MSPERMAGELLAGGSGPFDEPVLVKLFKAAGSLPGASSAEGQKALQQIRAREPALEPLVASIRDPRDRWLPEDSMWASELLPLGASIDEAIQHGSWRGAT